MSPPSHLPEQAAPAAHNFSVAAQLISPGRWAVGVRVCMKEGVCGGCECVFRRWEGAVGGEGKCDVLGCSGVQR